MAVPNAMERRLGDLLEDIAGDYRAREDGGEGAEGTRAKATEPSKNPYYTKPK